MSRTSSSVAGSGSALTTESAIRNHTCLRVATLQEPDPLTPHTLGRQGTWSALNLAAFQLILRMATQAAPARRRSDWVQLMDAHYRVRRNSLQTRQATAARGHSLGRSWLGCGPRHTLWLSRTHIFYTLVPQCTPAADLWQCWLTTLAVELSPDVSGDARRKGRSALGTCER